MIEHRRISRQSVEGAIAQVLETVVEAEYPAAPESLARPSIASQQCLEELVIAAQQEAAERAKRKQKQSKATLQEEAAQLAHEVLQAPAGFEQFSARLLKLLKSHGVEWPTVTIEYRGVNVTTQALVGNAGIPTVGNVLPQVAKDLFTKGGQTQDLHILRDVKGVLKPGAMTLLLGSPGSGKSTLQKLLSGRLNSKMLKVDGRVTYNGKDFSQFVVERTAAYVDQYDRHLPMLTVAETMEFAHACSGRMPDFFSKQDFKDIIAASVTGNFFPQSPAPKTADTKAVAGAGIPTSDAEAAESIQVADTIMDANGFVHAPNEQGLNQEAVVELLRLQNLHGSNFKVELVMRLLGLAHVRDTLIGNNMVRGVSGGEKKRVTSGEMLVGNQRVLMMDEISTGLDSATLYSIITFLKQSVGVLKTVALISLLQPPPEVMGLCDDVMLMAEGCVIYHGPVSAVQQHFEALGFDLPERMDVPSWLVELTTPQGQWKYAGDDLKQQWSKSQQSLTAAVQHNTAEPLAATIKEPVTGPPLDPVTGRPPMLCTPESMQAAFWNGNQHGIEMAKELEIGLDHSAANPRSLVQKRFALNTLAALKLSTHRQWTLFLRNKAFLTVRMMQVIIMGLVIGSLFFNCPPNRTGVRVLLGASFITMVFLAFGSAPELGLIIMNRPVWYKHRDNLFLPTSAELTSTALVRALNTAIESLLFTNIVYWMVGYTRTAGAYFTYLLVMFLLSLSMSGLFRALGSISATTTHAQAYGSVGILILILTSGFAIIKPSIPGWWIWAYYISPFSWALRSIAINEMTEVRWTAAAPGNPKGLTLGEEGLDTFGFFTSNNWIWAGVGYLIGFSLLMNILAFLALKYYSGQQPRASIPDERDILKRRLRAEHRKQLAAQHITIKEGPDGSGMSVMAAAGRPGMHPEGTAAGSRDFVPVTLVVRDLKYFVPNPAYSGGSKTGAAGTGAAGAEQSTAPEVPKELELLKGVNCFTEPGRLMCLMGGSGAGKTTLMDVIAGRKTVGRITGDILVNGKAKQQAKWARQVGYVEQNDIHSPATTVAEALWFSGRLRLPPSVSADEVHRRVDEVLVQVDLTDRHSDLVGVPGASGLPTEARKRLTIAVELVARPPVIFMDEPTSGLDARAAAIVMQSVKAVAAAGHTVMVTIHQPSIQLFEAFDTLLLLQRGGRVTYFGPLGLHSCSLVTYLESVSGTCKLLHGYNPATWMLEVTGGAMATLTPANKSVDWPDTYLASQLFMENINKAQALTEDALQNDTAGPATLTAGALQSAATHEVAVGSAQPFATQLLECTRRLYMAYWRMPSYNLLRLILTVITAIIYGSMYYQVGQVSVPASIGSVQNVLGVLYSSASFLGNINLMSAMPVFAMERGVFYRERASLMYSPLALSCATLLSELPYVVAQTSLFVPIVYWMIDFAHDASLFFYYYLMTFCCLMMYTALGMFLVSATPAVEIGQLLSSLLNSLWQVFNGFTIAYNNFPDGWKWANRITPVTWIIYGLSASQLGDNQTPLKGPGVAADATVSSYLRDTFGYEHWFRWYALLIVIAYVVGFMLLAVAFMHKSFLKR